MENLCNSISYQDLYLDFKIHAFNSRTGVIGSYFRGFQFFMCLDILFEYKVMEFFVNLDMKQVDNVETKNNVLIKKMHKKPVKLHTKQCNFFYWYKTDLCLFKLNCF